MTEETKFLLENINEDIEAGEVINNHYDRIKGLHNTYMDITKNSHFSSNESINIMKILIEMENEDICEDEYDDDWDEFENSGHLITQEEVMNYINHDKQDS